MLDNRKWVNVGFLASDVEFDKERHVSISSLPSAKARSSEGAAASGVVALLGFGILALAWATFIPIDSVVVAPGAVESFDDVRTVIHPDGGVISNIFVKEGSAIKAGTVLLQFDGAALNAELSEVNSTIKRDRAIIERDEAERREQEPLGLKQSRQSDDEEGSSSQRRLLSDHLKVRVVRDRAFRLEVSQVEETVASSTRQIHSMSIAKAAAEDDLRIARTLLASGSGSRSRLNQALRAVSQQEAEYEELCSRVRSEVAKRSALVFSHEQDLASERVATETEQNQVERELLLLYRRKLTISAAINRLAVRSPVDGQVSLLTHKMTAESVQPGSLLAEIVPDKELTVIIAHVPAQYMDEIRVGQAAELKAFSTDAAAHVRTMGLVSWVSRSVIANKENSGPYFSVAIQLATPPIVDGLAFTHVGYPLQVAFAQRTESFLGYLFRPASPGRV